MSEAKQNLDKAAREFEQWVRDELHTPPEYWISHFDSRHRKGEPCNQCQSQPVEHKQPAREGEERVSVELIDGEAGRCIGINDYRVCGPKPIHGVVVRSWKTTKNDVLRAFLTPDEKHDWLAKELTVIPVEQARLAALVPGLQAALEQIAELEGDDENQRFKLTRFQAAQIARRAFHAVNAIAKESRQ